MSLNMFKRKLFPFTLGAILSALLLLIPPGLIRSAQASSHREAPAISMDPTADNTDVYAFRSYEEGRGDFVTIIANFVPLEVPQAGPNFYKFDPAVLYEIMIDNNGDGREDVTYQFRFRTETLNPDTFLIATGPITSLDDEDYNVRQFFSVTRVDGPRRNSTGRGLLGNNLAVPPPNIGPASTPDYASLAEEGIHTLTDESRVYAGPREEPFFVDLGAIFDLLQLRDPGVDGAAGVNVHSIAIEVPIRQITSNNEIPSGPDDPNGVIGIWSTASRASFSLLTGAGGAPIGLPVFGFPSFTQVSRLGQPLVNEVVIPLGMKDRFNASQPSGDGQFLDFVTDPEVPMLLNALFGIDVPPTPRNDLVEVFLTGIAGLNQPAGVAPAELLRLNLGIPFTAADSINPMGVVGGDLAGFPNGRRLQDDVVDIILQVAAGLLVDGTGEELGDGVDANDQPFLNVFPYLALPNPGRTDESGMAQQVLP